MKNVKALIGMPVILDGKRLGRTLDIGVTQDLKNMTGVYVDCGIRGNRFVPSDQIRLVGDVAIFVDSKGRRSRCNGMGQPRRALSTDGRRLGAVCGVLIDEEMQTIEALELSRGYIDDLIGGRQYVRHYTVSQGGDDVVIYSNPLSAEPAEGGNTP